METILKKRFPISLSEKTKRIIFEVIINAFVLLFIYTAVSKIMTFHTFNMVLHRSVLIKHFSAFVAYAIPAIEILLSILLIIPKTKRVAIIGSFILMIVFTAYLVYMVYSGAKLTCNCGGVISSMTWKQHILFNISFILLAGIGIWISSNKKQENSH